MGLYPACLVMAPGKNKRSKRRLWAEIWGELTWSRKDAMPKVQLSCGRAGWARALVLSGTASRRVVACLAGDVDGQVHVDRDWFVVDGGGLEFELAKGFDYGGGPELFVGLGGP